jgi:hypothetical protein
MEPNYDEIDPNEDLENEGLEEDIKSKEDDDWEDCDEDEDDDWD